MKQGKGREGDREVICKVAEEYPLLSMNLSQMKDQMTVSKKNLTMGAKKKLITQM